MTSGVAWFALILAIIAIVVIIIFIIIFFVERNRGIPLKLQFGSSGSSDTMVTGGNNLYIVNSGVSSGFTLNFASNSTNVVGSELFIFNSSSQQITLNGGGNVTVTGSTTVGPGAFAELVYTDTDSSLLRVL